MNDGEPERLSLYRVQLLGGDQCAPDRTEAVQRREGGNNTQQIRMVGAVNYGQVTLKRGMTSSFDLWDWFDVQQHGNPQQLRKDIRADVDVVVIAADRKTELVRFVLRKCLITKLKAPVLNAKDGVVAIEEMQLCYESMTLKRPQGAA